MKNSGSVRKKGLIKRLAQESLILSRLGKFSSRLIYFLKVSMLSFLLTGCQSADNALETGIAGSYVKEKKLTGRIIKPLKRIFSTSVEESFLGGIYRKVLSRAIYTPTRTYGAFFLTFGIYIALVYYVKQYALYLEASRSSLEIAMAIIVASIPLLLSGKPLVRLLGDSVFLDGTFSGCIDFSYYDGEKQPAAVGTAIILGSVLGALTLFSGEVRMLLFIFAVLFALVVFHSPEMGLVAVALVFPFAGSSIVSALTLASFISYLLKVLRGKRNFHPGASGTFVGILGFMFFFNWLNGGGEKALFALCMCMVYILAANLLTTPRLLRKCVSAFVTGFGICALVAAVQIFNSAWVGDSWVDAVKASLSVFEDSGTFAGYIILVLPFVFCKANRGRFASKAFCYLLFVGYIAYAVYLGHTFFAVLAAIGVTMHLAISARRIFRPLILCLGIPIAGLYFANVSITYSGMGLYGIMEGWTAAVSAATPHAVLGVGMSEASVGLAFSGDSNSMFLQIFIECGFMGMFLLILGIVFAMQRLYASLSKVGTGNRVITAAAGASALSALVLGCGINLWAHTELCVAFWLCLGLSSAAYRLRMEQRREADE